MYKEPDYQSRAEQLTRRIRDPKMKMNVREVSNAIGTIQNLRAKWNGLSGILTLIVFCFLNILGVIDLKQQSTFTGQNLLMIGFGLALFGCFGVIHTLLGYIYYFQADYLLLKNNKFELRNKIEAVDFLKKQDPVAATILGEIERVK